MPLPRTNNIEYVHAQKTLIITTPMYTNGISFRGPCGSKRLCLVSESSDREVSRSQSLTLLVCWREVGGTAIYIFIVPGLLLLVLAI